MVAEIVLITLLVIPMPSNDVRGAITTFVANLWEAQVVRYTVYALLAIDVFYFWFVFDALLHPLYDYGIVRNPAVEMGITCEAKQNLFYNERNAYITGGSIFLFFILNRLVDIQDKLHKSRHQVKSLGATGGAGAEAKSTGAKKTD